jgi:hypothetical protein
MTPIPTGPYAPESKQGEKAPSGSEASITKRLAELRYTVRAISERRGGRPIPEALKAATRELLAVRSEIHKLRPSERGRARRFANEVDRELTEAKRSLLPRPRPRIETWRQGEATRRSDYPADARLHQAIGPVRGDEAPG